MNTLAADMLVPGLVLATARVNGSGLVVSGASKFDAVAQGPQEARRAAGLLGQQDRHRFLAGREVLRRLVAQSLNVDRDELFPDFFCQDCGRESASSHGIPGYQLRGNSVDVAVSLSRSSDWILAAVIPKPGYRLGIDLQDVAGVAFDGFEENFLTRSERVALESAPKPQQTRLKGQIWARKEALLKMSGQGLRRELSNVETMLPTSSAAQLWDIDPHDLGLPATLAISVAAQSLL